MSTEKVKDHECDIEGDIIRERMYLKGLPTDEHYINHTCSICGDLGPSIEEPWGYPYRKEFEKEDEDE